MPKGKLLIIGGAEYTGEDDYDNKQQKKQEFERFEILKELLPSAKNKQLEVITTGTKMHEEVKKRYQKAFRKIGVSHPGFMPIKDKSEAHDEQFIERIKKAEVVFFTGGDQFRLSTILGGTPIIEVIKERYHHDKDFIVAGTSAGAMAMSSIMITSGGHEEALFGRDLKTTSGLGLIHNCIIDTHFIKRGRFGRLAHAVITNPDQMGIGLGEDTALIIKNGDSAEVRGSGMVVIIDGREIRQTNITSVKEIEPVYVENFIVHLLVKGCRFSIKKRKLFKPAIKISQQKKQSESSKKVMHHA